jgi:hypothetical protein
LLRFVAEVDFGVPRRTISLACFGVGAFGAEEDIEQLRAHPMFGNGASDTAVVHFTIPGATYCKAASAAPTGAGQQQEEEEPVSLSSLDPTLRRAHKGRRGSLFVAYMVEVAVAAHAGAPPVLVHRCLRRFSSLLTFANALRSEGLVPASSVVARAAPRFPPKKRLLTATAGGMGRLNVSLRAAQLAAYFQPLFADRQHGGGRLLSAPLVRDFLSKSDAVEVEGGGGGVGQHSMQQQQQQQQQQHMQQHLQQHMQHGGGAGAAAAPPPLPLSEQQLQQLQHLSAVPWGAGRGIGAGSSTLAPPSEAGSAAAAAAACMGPPTTAMAPPPLQPQPQQLDAAWARYQSEVSSAVASGAAASVVSAGAGGGSLVSTGSMLQQHQLQQQRALMHMGAQPFQGHSSGVRSDTRSAQQLSGCGSDGGGSAISTHSAPVWNNNQMQQMQPGLQLLQGGGGGGVLSYHQMVRGRAAAGGGSALASVSEYGASASAPATALAGGGAGGGGGGGGTEAERRQRTVASIMAGLAAGQNSMPPSGTSVAGSTVGASRSDSRITMPGGGRGGALASQVVSGAVFYEQQQQANSRRR